MNIVFASDIHGSATWCGKLMDQIELLAPDRVVLLGDLLYHGPRNPLPDGYNPQEVARMLNGIAPLIVAVRGNCEAEVDQMMLDFPCMADYALVADGPLRVFCTHGHLWGPDNLPPHMPGDVFASGHTHVKMLETVKLGNAEGAAGATALPGTTSEAGAAAVPSATGTPGTAGRAAVSRMQNTAGAAEAAEAAEAGVRAVANEIRLLNPGSVSLPKDGSHSFATYLNGEFALRVLG